MKKLLKKLCCKIGWHSPKHMYEFVKYDGVKGLVIEYRCPWCGYVGMLDSQWNLF